MEIFLYEDYTLSYEVLAVDESSIEMKTVTEILTTLDAEIDKHETQIDTLGNYDLFNYVYLNYLTFGSLIKISYEIENNIYSLLNPEESVDVPVSATSVSATPVSATPVSATPVSATPVSSTPVSAKPEEGVFSKALSATQNLFGIKNRETSKKSVGSNNSGFQNVDSNEQPGFVSTVRSFLTRRTSCVSMKLKLVSKNTKGSVKRKRKRKSGNAREKSIRKKRKRILTKKNENNNKFAHKERSNINHIFNKNPKFKGTNIDLKKFKV